MRVVRSQILVASLVLCFVAAMPTISFGASIAYIHRSGGSINYLTNYGHTVTEFYNPVGLQLSQLQGYDVVIVTSNSQFTDNQNIGNVVADFADAGGGVILTEFCFQPITELAGRIMQSDYSPFSYSNVMVSNNLTSTLGTVYVPDSELFTGVSLAQVQTVWQSDPGLNDGAVLVADWASGRKAIAYRDLAENRIISLNLFPDVYYTTNTNTQKLISNAVEYSMVPEPLGFSMLILGGVMLGKRFKK